MKRTILYLIICGAALCSSACDFLDQVPDDRLTLEQVFATRKNSEDYLATIYSYRIDESTVSYDMSKINLGNWSASSDYFNNWTPLYEGIRAATTFMQHIRSNKEMVANGETERIEQYYNEARFLRAYFSFLILRQYGPIVLVKDELIPPDADSSHPQMQMMRSPYDECVNWIADELDAAAEGLPFHFTDQLSTDYGRATGATCMAVKARLLLYAASPQFNGNPAYKDVVNPDGTHLFATEYDADKWRRAADAAYDIIKTNKFQLYMIRLILLMNKYKINRF